MYFRFYNSKEMHLPSFMSIYNITHIVGGPAWSVPYDTHENEVEVVFVCDGSGVLTINGIRLQLAVGSLVVIEAGQIHSFKSDMDQPLNFWAWGISVDELKESEEKSFLHKNVYPMINADSHGSFIAQTLTELQQLLEEKNDRSVAIAHMMMNSLNFFIQALFLQNSHPFVMPEATKMKQVLHYLNSHYSEKITLESLSNKFHTSVTHLSRLFSEVYGNSPIDCLIDLRLNRAKDLLFRTEDPVCVISEKIGYENVHYFSNLFTKRIGCTPKQYREACFTLPVRNIR